MLDALAEGLAEVLAGFEVLDRNVAFDGGVVADLAAVDGAGRATLVQLADEDVDRAALAALDLAALARRDAELVARHLAGPGLSGDLDPRVVVVCPGPGAELLARRLVPLLGRGVELFGVRTVASARSERSYLVPLFAGGDVRPAVRENPEQAFLESVPAPLAELARDLVRRIARLDEDLDVGRTPTAIRWRFRGEILVRVELVGERLQASVAPDHEAIPVRRGEDVELVLEAALSHVVRRFGAGLEEEGAPVSRPDEPVELLSPEEIEAFRD